MEIKILKKKIEQALKTCKDKLENQASLVLSEADFERLVSWSIMNELGQANYESPTDSNDFVVHTQVSSYIKEETKPNRRVDILVVPESKILEGTDAESIPRKGFATDAESIALELKYLHEDDSAEIIGGDICKREDLSPNSLLYVVVCIEADEPNLFERKKRKIESIKRSYLRRSNKEYKRKLVCYYMQKNTLRHYKMQLEQTQQNQIR